MTIILYCNHCGYCMGFRNKLKINVFGERKCKQCRIVNTPQDIESSFNVNDYRLIRRTRKQLRRDYRDRQIYIQVVKDYCNGKPVDTVLE